MSTKMIRIALTAFAVAGVSAAAQAEYRCDPAPAWADRAACEAAAQGPTELRRTVQAMNTLRLNLRFEDYVNEATAQKWAQAKPETQVAERKEDASLKLASAAR